MPLCAMQVEGESTFCIPDCPSDVNLKERSNIAIIRVVFGRVIARQFEQEFTNILGANVWRWNAKKVDETRFTMRFANAQLIKDWGHFNLIIKTTPAQIKIKPWSPVVGAKGELQTAWLRVKGIAYDKKKYKDSDPMCSVNMCQSLGPPHSSPTVIFCVSCIETDRKWVSSSTQSKILCCSTYIVCLSVFEQREIEKSPQNSSGGAELTFRATLALLYIGVTIAANSTLSPAPRRNLEPCGLLELAAFNECGGP